MEGWAEGGGAGAESSEGERLGLRWEVRWVYLDWLSLGSTWCI